MEVRSEAHEKNRNGMGYQPSKIKRLGREVVSQGTPKGRRKGRDDTSGTLYGADPQKGFLERIGADIEDIERQKDIEEIERGSCSELGEGDENQISITGLLSNHFYSRFKKILNHLIVDDPQRVERPAFYCSCCTGRNLLTDYGGHKGMEKIIECGRNGACAVFLNQGRKNSI